MDPAYDYAELYRTLTRRYGHITPEALIKVLCPLHVGLRSISPQVSRVPGGSLWRASFEAEVTSESREAIQPGRTGKFIPASHVVGGPWREIAKGRILTVTGDVAQGEVYTGDGREASVESAVAVLTTDDVLEIDQYGAGAKVLSALVESSLATRLIHEGYLVKRMPEDIARHVGAYFNYDFLVERATEARRVEVKSLWGTDTRYARLIHGTGRDYPTSSCKFDTQDIFAVSLFLRSGQIEDFAFARAVPRDSLKPYGLPAAAAYPAHVNQNPLCGIGDGTWFAEIDAVWDLP